MYCIECGEIIPENSKFCSHCGSKQNNVEPISRKHIASGSENLTIKDNTSTVDYNFLKKASGYYLAWILLHLGILLIASDGIFKDSNMGSKTFWPFGRLADFDETNQYDITEFLIYTIFPFAIIFVISLFRKSQPTQVNQE